MKIRKRNFSKKGEAQNFWPSFTDVMATIALVLFFLMLLAYIQYIVTGKNLEAAGKNLEMLNRQLDDTQLKLESSKAEINNAKDELRLLQDEIAQTKAEVDQGKIDLKLSQLEIDKQKKIIANSNQELAKLRAKLQNIAVLRVDILKSRGSYRTRTLSPIRATSTSYVLVSKEITP
jgi:chemotaxis protein MotB